jgi:hypothetical protein
MPRCHTCIYREQNLPLAACCCSSESGNLPTRSPGTLTTHLASEQCHGHVQERGGRREEVTGRKPTLGQWGSWEPWRSSSLNWNIIPQPWSDTEASWQNIRQQVPWLPVPEEAPADFLMRPKLLEWSEVHWHRHQCLKLLILESINPCFQAASHHPWNPETWPCGQCWFWDPHSRLRPQAAWSQHPDSACVARTGHRVDFASCPFCSSHSTYSLTEDIEPKGLYDRGGGGPTPISSCAAVW